MKKITLLTILSLVSISLFASTIGTKWNNIALSDSKGVLNPANIGFIDEDSPSFSTYFLFSDEYSKNYIDSLLQYPQSEIGATFFGTNLALTFNIKNYILKREVNENNIEYNGRSRYTLQLDWGYKIENFALGLRIKGGSELEKFNCYLRPSFFAIPDYLVNTFFSRYDPVIDSQFFNVGLGFRYQYKENLSLALVTDSDIDISTDSQEQVDVSTFIKDISFGYTGITNKYSSSGELNLFRFKLSNDFIYIGNPEKREVRIGTEFRFQVSRDFYSSLYAGIAEKKPTILKLFTIDPSYASSTFGLSFNWSNYELYLNSIIPFSFFSSTNTDEDKIRVEINFKYQI